MNRLILLFLFIFSVCVLHAQDWKDISIPADAGEGKEWELQDDVSDDFNYDFVATSLAATIGNKWTNYYHNTWQGPKPTVWKRNHVFVEDGNMKIKASRGSNVTFNYNGKSYTLPASYLGCVTSTKRVVYPVYVETRVKIMKSVLASDVWMLSADDTQEIDICEAYGSDRYKNEWFSNKRLHLSHHVFIRSPFQDWQPNDVGSFYTDGTTVWSDGYHRIGVYWKDPWSLEYYVDGKLVRQRSGENQIDPKGYTNGKGLHKAMDIIINTEDQTWRAVQELTPTDREMSNTDDNTFKVDWVRIYKPVNISTGSLEIKKNETLKVFPNPVVNVLEIHGSSKQISQVRVNQIDGKEISHLSPHKTAFSINTERFQSGVYIVNLQFADGTFELRKIIKK